MGISKSGGEINFLGRTPKTKILVEMFKHLKSTACQKKKIEKKPPMFTVITRNLPQMSWYRFKFDVIVLCALFFRSKQYLVCVSKSFESFDTDYISFLR